MDLLQYVESPQYTQIVVLSRLRKMGGVKLEEAAEAMGISKSLLSLFEVGKREVTSRHIEQYSAYLQKRLGLKKGNLHDVLLRLSADHRVTGQQARENPIDFLYTYLKECCD